MNQDRPSFEETSLANQGTDTVRDPYLKQFLQAADECIAHHPWRAVAYAGVFGLILGLLLGDQPRPKRDRKFNLCD